MIRRAIVPEIDTKAILEVEEYRGAIFTEKRGDPSQVGMTIFTDQGQHNVCMSRETMMGLVMNMAKALASNGGSSAQDGRLN